MKANKILAATLLMAGALGLKAQETVTEITFVPHWFVQGQFGAQETLGEASFSKLLSPNAQVATGYMFNPYIGARLSVNGWQSKAANYIQAYKNIEGYKYNWKWNYVAPTASVVVNLTNAFGGYNPERLVDVNLYAGIGANVGYNNGEAADACADYQKKTGVSNMLGHLWDGTKTRFTSQVGADVNFNLTRNLALGVEVNANILNDKYNSKKAGNADWYFNGLVGLKYTFGPTYTKTVREIPAPEPVIIEKIVERIVEVPVAAPAVQEQVVNAVAEAPAEMRRDIFFKIATTNISTVEMAKVKEVAEFLKENPKAKVVVTGYADRATGTPAINARLCKQRAQAVANVLTQKFAIAKSRIVVKAMGADEAEPYKTPAENRVAIAICE